MSEQAKAGADGVGEPGTDDREPTVFELIATRKIPAEIVYEDDSIVAFKDVAPKAPVHIVVTTKVARDRNVVELAARDPALLARLVAAAERVAREQADGEFRLIFNTGAGAGQSVFHVHGHVLAGGLTEGSLAAL